MFWKGISWLQIGTNGGLSLAGKRTLKLHRYRSLLGKLHTARRLDRVLKILLVRQEWYSNTFHFLHGHYTLVLITITLIRNTSMNNTFCSTRCSQTHFFFQTVMHNSQYKAKRATYFGLVKPSPGL